MTSPAKIAANRANSTKSSGPRTPEGKAVSAMNRLSHGLRAAVVVVPGEDPAEWENFREKIVASLEPENLLEAELASRVASGLWRLRRCDAMEALRAEATVATAIENPDMMSRLTERDAEREVFRYRQRRDDEEFGSNMYARPSALARLPEWADEHSLTGSEVEFMLDEVNLAIDKSDLELVGPRFLSRLGLPPDATEAPWAWTGWTAGLARMVLRAVADEYEVELDDIVADAVETLREYRARGRQLLQEAEEALLQKEEVVTAVFMKRLLDAIEPNAERSKTLGRYEAHHFRAVRHALDALEKLQAKRRA
jgi:hypothetical protein